MNRSAHFSPRLFTFLRELKRHNTRVWFEANKQRYLDDVRDPTLRFIEDFGLYLAQVSDHFVADPRPNGGSLFRIYRDTRFAKDKSPYKTHVGAQFRHDAGSNAHAPGFYLHLEPGGAFGGGGIWHPEAKELERIRRAIVGEPARWKRATQGKGFTGLCALDGEQLKRPPRGFDPAHPLIEDLKRKDFFGVASFTEREVCQPDFIARYARVCRACGPLVQLLTEAVGLSF
jgi:uncharacterized protein (TIGR02453 family)